MLRWLFLDMDNYFASAEQQADPRLRGRPVGVIPVISRGTCCIAASREAKAFGVKTGTGVLEARKRCPGIRFVVARPDAYIALHHRILAAIDAVLPVERVESIDEMALRLLGPEREPDRALALGRAVKRSITDAVGACLTCSVGVAPSRLLAKIASELGKPDGLTRLDGPDLPDALLHLSLTDLPGINTGLRRRLEHIGVTDVAGLWRLSRARMRDAWGSVNGLRFWADLHGQDVPPPATRRSSFGHANVLAPELRTHDGAHAIMTRLLHKAAARLRAHGYLARGLSAHTRLRAGESVAHWRDAIELPACCDTPTIVEHFERLRRSYPGHACPPGATPSHVGVTLGRLTPAASATGQLFVDPARRDALSAAMDDINTRFGGHKLYLGGMHAVARRDMPDKIAFGRVPDEDIRM